MKSSRYYWILMLACASAIWSCSDDNSPAPVEEKALIEANQIGTRSAGEIQLLMQLYGRNMDPSAFRYNVTTYRVKYRTTYNGEEITASGVICVPTASSPVSALSFQHGTIVEHREAPSALDDDDPEILLMEVLASSGFLTLVPDYIGFGASTDRLHPYYAEEPTANAVLDMLIAGKVFAEENEVELNNKLYLAGYSQGGYATMAAHKAIEETGFDAFDLVASFPAAGGYDLEAMRSYFFNLERYHQPFYMAYVAMSYNTYFGYEDIVSDFFNEPYASRIPTLFDGINTQGHINGQLTDDIRLLVREDLRENFFTAEEFEYLRSAFQENSLTDWAPEHKMYMYHGDADTTVPFENSVITYEKLIANGTAEANIEFIPIPGADHSTGVEPYLNDLIQKLQAMD